MLISFRTTRFASFPDYLVIQIKKFTFGLDWVPKKLGKKDKKYRAYKVSGVLYGYCGWYCRKERNYPKRSCRLACCIPSRADLPF